MLAKTQAPASLLPHVRAKGGVQRTSVACFGALGELDSLWGNEGNVRCCFQSVASCLRVGGHLALCPHWVREPELGAHTLR